MPPFPSGLPGAGRSEAALVVNNLLIGVEGISAIHCETDKIFLPKMLHNDVFSPGPRG
jgi:hypothetical protein